MASPAGLPATPLSSAGDGPTLGDAAASTAFGGVRSWRPTRIAVLTALVGLLVIGSLTVAATVVYENNEDRLLDLRVRELGLVLSGAASSIQSPLASAAELADATDGDVARVGQFMRRYVGSDLQFDGAALWDLSGARPRRIIGMGDTLALSSRPALAGRLFARAGRERNVAVQGLLSSEPPRLGYAFRAARGSRYAMYAESALPANRRSRIASGSAFSDLDYAFYLGRSQAQRDLLVTSLTKLPPDGRKTSTTVPFGADSLTVLVTPRHSLGGRFFRSLPAIIAIAGLLLVLGAALVADRLARRRLQAEQMAGILDTVAAENHRMYTEQRNISQTLQNAMLPDSLPEIEGLSAIARYLPAASGIEVGGDWYDLVVVDEDKVLLIVGDVTGNGLQASTTMAALRQAALAYAAQDGDPASILTDLAEYVENGRHDYFATVLCALVDLDAGRLTVATAGHPPPLLLDGGSDRFVELDVGPPIGAPAGRYASRVIEISSDAALLAFTDGLVERRGEVIDVGLERLRRTATAYRHALDELVDMLASELGSGAHDDAAIVGLRWRRR